MTVLPEGTRMTVNPDETPRCALGRVGLRYRVGCRRVGCGICKVRLILGEVRYERPMRSGCSRMSNEWKTSASVAMPADHQHRHRASGGRPIAESLGPHLSKSATDLITAGLQPARHTPCTSYTLRRILMGYELRTNTIEPRRSTFDPARERFGDKPASRYQEATYGMQPMEYFHYRPFWGSRSMRSMTRTFRRLN